MKKLLFSLILSFLPFASGAIQYEYFNPLMPQNGALKVNQTIGQLTPPQGKGFGVLSALTNLQSVASSIATNEYGIQVDTLGLVCPTEEAVVAAISVHNTNQSAHSYIQNRITVNTTAIDANATAIQKTREDFAAADTDLQNQITAHTGEISTLRNDLDGLGDQVSGIEEKIPETASSTNQLATKADLETGFNDYVKKSGDTMTGDLSFDIVDDKYKNIVWNPESEVWVDDITVETRKYLVGPKIVSTGFDILQQYPTYQNASVELGGVSVESDKFYPARSDGVMNLGARNRRWNTTYTQQLNSGASGNDIIVPTEGGTLARIEDLQDVRADYMQADSELQQQISAHATAITNLDGEVDTINGKIPASASTTNLLATITDLDATEQDVRDDYMAADADLQTQINGQATAIAGNTDDITEINGKISSSASSTNKLISASELTAESQDIRSDYMAADSELQTQINGQATAITTLRNDTDDLGDQVAGIEGKIPAAASSSNQLALNSQITSLQTQITTNTNNFTNYRTSAAQDVIDSNLQSQITNGLALKLDKDQGSENQGKVLSVGSDGQITLTAAPGGGLQAVVHNSTLTGAGTDASPLGIASSVLSELADKADQTVVDTLASAVSSIQTDYTPKATTTALSNTVSGIQSDYVSKTAAAAQTIVSSLQMPELSVGTAEGTLNLSITAGVATIATNNGLDIISQTKFDTSPTTDDTTTWANATDASLVNKAQVASALNGKADADLGNIPTNYDYVIESQLPTSANGYTWYRKYKSGWVEQGGFLANTASGTVVTFLVEMANIYFDVHIQSRLNNYGTVTNTGSVGNSTTTSFTHYHYNDTVQSWSWQVSGLAAQ